jgi:hypothetical protein
VVSAQVLHLVVPGLLGPMPRLDAAQARQRFPTLERWLARADRSSVPADEEALLFQLFGLAVPGEADLPSAPLCYLADTGQPPVGVVYHATPVYLRPDQDRLLLFDAPAADLSSAEADAFVQAFNQHFAADGWRLSAPVPGRWYLQVGDRPALRTHPLGEVIGRNVDLFLPEGPDARQWRQRLNEVQMLFHGLAVNAAREADGRVPVNSLWLHGGGVLPAAVARLLQVAPPASPLLEGLCRLGGSPVAERLCWLGQARRAVWDADPQAWLAAADQVEQLLHQASGETVLYPGDGHAYRYRPAHRWRLWRRPRPLTACLLSES